MKRWVRHTLCGVLACFMVALGVPAVLLAQTPIPFAQLVANVAASIAASSYAGVNVGGAIVGVGGLPLSTLLRCLGNGTIDGCTIGGTTPAPGTFTTIAGNASGATVTATGGSTARSVADRAGEVINVLDNGVKCDGATDDYTALNAILTGRATTHPNSIVYFPPNPNAASGNTTCMLSHDVFPPSNTILRAYPGTVTLKPTAGNTSIPLLLDAANVSNVLIYGLTLDGGGKDFAIATAVNTVFQSSQVIFDHVTFQHARGIPANFSTSNTYSGVRDSTFIDIGNHWKTTALTADRRQALSFCCGTTANSYGNFATGNVFSDIGLDAISVGNQTDFLVAHNRFYLADGQITATWSDPQPVAFGAAVYVGSANTVSVIGNVIEGAQGNAIDVNENSPATPTAKILISGNNITGSGQTGIGCFNGICTITGNSSRDSNQWSASGYQGAVVLGGGSAGVSNTVSATLVGNLLSDDQGTPTQLYGVQTLSNGGLNTFGTISIDHTNIFSGNKNAAFGGFGAIGQGYTDAGGTSTLAAVVANGAAGTVPASAALRDIYIQESAGHAVTGGVNIGTTAGAADVASAVPVGANGLVVIDATTTPALLKRYFSASSAQSLFVSAVTGWNNASLNVRFVYDQ